MSPRASLIETINNLEKEIEKLRLANVALQRQRDNLEDEKDDMTKDNDRHLKVCGDSKRQNKTW